MVRERTIPTARREFLLSETAMGNQAPPAGATEPALFKRLQRKLKHQGQHLHRCRQDSRDLPTLGRYYVTNTAFNAVVVTHVDLADWLAEVA